MVEDFPPAYLYCCCCVRLHGERRSEWGIMEGIDILKRSGYGEIDKGNRRVKERSTYRRIRSPPR